MFDNELCFESLFIHTEHFHGPFQSLFPEMSLVLGNFLELFDFVYQSYVIFFFFLLFSTFGSFCSVSGEFSLILPHSPYSEVFISAVIGLNHGKLLCIRH